MIRRWGGLYQKSHSWAFSQRTLNRYPYVQNNPVNFTDPEGLFVQAIPAICVANPALCAGIGAITIGTIIQILNNPPIVPPMLFTPLQSPEQCNDEDDDNCEKQALVDEAICRSLNEPGARDRC